MVHTMERSAIKNKICYNCWNSISHPWKNCPEAYRSVEEKEILRCERRFPLTHWWADLLKDSNVKPGTFPRNETMDLQSLIDKDRQMRKEANIKKHDTGAMANEGVGNLIDFDELEGGQGSQITPVGNIEDHARMLIGEQGYCSEQEIYGPDPWKVLSSPRMNTNSLSGIEASLTELVGIFKNNARISQDIIPSEPDKVKPTSSQDISSKDIVDIYLKLHNLQKCSNTAAHNDKKLEASINSITKRLEFLETDQRNFQNATRHKLERLEKRLKEVNTPIQPARNLKLEQTVNQLEARMKDVKDKQENFEDQIPTAGDVVRVLNMTQGTGEGKSLKGGSVEMVQMQMRMNAMYDQQSYMMTQLQVMAGKMNQLDSRLRSIENRGVNGIGYQRSGTEPGKRG